MALDNLQISSVIVNQIADLQEFRFWIQVPRRPLAQRIKPETRSRQEAEGRKQKQSS
jgi:hypothetical protein